MDEPNRQTLDVILTGRTNWVRLRTLTVLRWIAIIGQSAALFGAIRWFDVEPPVGACIAVISLAVVANLFALVVYPENKRLSEREVAAMLLFDVCQLAALLSLTGGLSNPFALLILAPVTISATALGTRTTLFIGAVAVVLVSAISLWSIPLTTRAGHRLQLGHDFTIGFWSAIVIGVVFLSLYARRVSMEVHDMAEALAATQMALAREQKLTDLGGVVAAAAHELGTPLATIKLTASEMADDLPEGSDARADAELIAEQANRCRDILRSMGRAGKDDWQLKFAPLRAVVEEAAAPHADRGKRIEYDVRAVGGTELTEPMIQRRPEMIHGLRNLIQNAVDFSQEVVWIDVRWSDAHIRVRIVDDGPGFPGQLLGRIGDPFVRLRSTSTAHEERAAYEGMGLGLFIAKTLLERTGAELSFANGRAPFEQRARPGHRGGAVVDCLWPRDRIALPKGVSRQALPENPQMAEQRQSASGAFPN